MQPKNRTRLHEAARRLAEDGIPIFPCATGAKTPATPHWKEDATTDLARIDAWWETADYNIGLPLYQIGWCAIDIDTKKGDGNLNWTEYCERNDLQFVTYEVRTPSGGRHVYFAGSIPNSSGKLAQFIDTRGEGGYVLAPPSIVDGKEYTVSVPGDLAEVPACIVRDLAVTAPPTLAATDQLDLPVNIGRARQLLRDAVKRGDVAREGQGGDDRTYRMACEVLNLGLSPRIASELIDAEWNPHCVPPWNADELATKVENAARYAQNEAGAWATEPASQVFDTAALDKLVAEDKARPVPKSRFHARDVYEQDQAPDPEWIVPGLIQKATTVLATGQPKTYKSFLIYDVCAGIASGTETFGNRPRENGLVFYGAIEGMNAIMKARRHAWMIARGFDPIKDIEVLKNLYVLPGPRIARDGEVQAFGDEIKRVCDLRGVGPSLITIDTVAKAMLGLDENDAGDMGQMAEVMQSLVEAFGASTAAIHHSGKDEARGSRGSNALPAGVDTTLSFKVPQSGVRAVEVRAEAHKDGETPDDPWTFEGRKVGPALAFFPTTFAEHKALTQAENIFSPKRIGAALKAMGAMGDKPVSSHVLAAHLTPQIEGENQDQRQALVTTNTRTLARLAKTSLNGYATLTTHGLLWSLTEISRD